MKPKPSPCEDLQGDLFKVELHAIVNLNHALVKLARTVDWARLEETFGALYCEDNGAPGCSTRLTSTSTGCKSIICSRTELLKALANV